MIRWIVMSLTLKLVRISTAPPKIPLGRPIVARVPGRDKPSLDMARPSLLGGGLDAAASGSALLVDADDEVTFEDLVARDAQLGGRVELVQHQGATVPAHKLL